MSLPEVNLYPDFNTLRLSHLTLNVKDIKKSKDFYTHILGLQVTDESRKNVYFRCMEERGHHSLILIEGDEASCNSISFKVFSENDLVKAEKFFVKNGKNVNCVERPYQGLTLQTFDNQGIPLEFYFHMDRLPSIHQKYELYKGTKPLRIDHVNCFSTNVDETVAFYNEFGFRVTEYTEDSETKRLWAAWMQRKGGVHDIAFTNGKGPRLHHFAFWVANPLNIIDLLDLMATKGFVKNIERGPGRHGISNAFFLYILDPDGHRVEIYCSDYQTLDSDHEPIHWDLKDPQRQTLWGAPAPKSWFENGTFFKNIDVKTPTLDAKPIIAP